jgi:hypothetical protein
VPKSAATPHNDLPLRQAIVELREVTGDRRIGRQTEDTVTVLSRIELCLSRFVDQFQYLHGISAAGAGDIDVATRAGEHAGLSRALAGKMARSAPGSVGHKVLQLLLAKPDIDTPLLSDLVRCAADFTAFLMGSGLSAALESLVGRTIDLCDRLVTVSEGTDVKQAG